MTNQEVARQLQRLKGLLAKASDASDEDFYLQSHWARYLCILVSGFIENALKEIYSDFIHGNSSKPVAGYAIANLMKLNNPNAGRFLEISAAFKPDWRDQLEAFISEDGRKEAIDSIMANRHQIAHGGDVGITLVKVSDYLKKIVVVLEFIETQCRSNQ